MSITIWVVGTYCILATAAHIGSILIAARRCRKRRPVSVRSGGKSPLGVLGLTRFLRRRGLHYGKERLGGAAGAALGIPGVSLVRPVCGLENHIEDTLRSAFDLDYPRYEIIFCAAAANDSALPLVRRLIGDHPHVPARLLIGNDPISENPKLNNVCKGWNAAAYDRIVMADSNVLMPRDYIERLLAAWRADTGVVTSPPVGCRPQGFWAELECAFLNTYQVRWQYAAAAFAFGFAQGKSMLYRRRLIEAPFEQPLGYRSAAEVWARQLRWARLRQASFRNCYAVEILSGGVGPLLALAWVLAAMDLPVAGVVALATIWYGAEAALAGMAGWHLTVRSPLAWMLRDILLPPIWIGGWLGRGFVWRGNQVQTVESRGAI